MRITSKTLENTLYLAYNSNRETPARPPRRASPSASEAPPATIIRPGVGIRARLRRLARSRYVQPAGKKPTILGATGVWCSQRPLYILPAAK